MLRRGFKPSLLWLLISLLVLWVTVPFFDNVETHELFASLVAAVVLLSGVWASSERPMTLWIGVVVALSCLLLSVAGFAYSVPFLLSTGRGAYSIFCLYTVFVLFRHFRRAKEVDLDIIFGAISVYLLLGIAWAASYWVIYDINPDAFQHTTGMAASWPTFHHFLYFSMITLTTVGYGDITPASHFAQMWASLEAVCGTLYVAVVVARFVALYRPVNVRGEIPARPHKR